ICFVPNGDYARFVESYLDQKGVPAAERAGELVTTDGQPVGQHGGIHHFTVGQRKGLGVAVGKPIYVTEIRPATREVVVGDRELLLRKRFEVDRLNWISIAELTGPLRVQAKIRYQFQ